VHKNSFPLEIFLIRKFDVFEFFKLGAIQHYPDQIVLECLIIDHGYVTDRNRIPENARLANTYLFGRMGQELIYVGFYDSYFEFEYSLNNSGEGNFLLNFKSPFLKRDFF